MSESILTDDERRSLNHNASNYSFDGEEIDGKEYNSFIEGGNFIAKLLKEKHAAEIEELKIRMSAMVGTPDFNRMSDENAQFKAEIKETNALFVKHAQDYRSEIAQLNKDLDILEQGINDRDASISAFIRQQKVLREELTCERDTVDFYADKEMWDGAELVPHDCERLSGIDEDDAYVPSGKRARETVAKRSK